MNSIGYIIFLVATCFALTAQAEWQGVPVGSVTSDSFGPVEIKKIQKSLGIKVGEPLDELQIDRGTKALVGEGSIQALYVDVVSQGGKLKVVLKGRTPQKIRNIKFSGINPDVVEEARDNIVLRPGEITDSRVLSELKDRVRDSYRRRGYYDVKVLVKVLPVAGTNVADVEISARPGTRTLVGNVKVIGVDKKLEKELVEVFGLKEGQPFEVNTLEQRMGKVSAYLRENRFYGARLEQRTLKYNQDRSRVNVNLFIKLGNRFQFVFSGNTVFNEWQLRELLEDEELQNINAIENYSSKVVKEYKAVGYHFCRVEAREEYNETEGTNVIFMEILEGPKVKIGKVDFSRRFQIMGARAGLEDKELSQLFFAKAPGVLRRRVYWESGMGVALRQFSKSIRSMGYMSARISEPKVVFSKNKKRANLYFDVELGTRTRVTGIQCINNKRFANKELISKLPFKVGVDYSPKLVGEGLSALTRFYQNNGFVDVVVESDLQSDVQISRDQESALIKYHIKEGPQYRIGKIEIEGNKKTKRNVISRKLKIKEGGLYNPEAIAESEEAISLLGLFSRVQLQSEDSPDKKYHKDITVVLREIAPGVAEFGAGATYEDPLFRLRAFGGMGYSNLFGLNNTTSVRGEIRFPISGNRAFPFLEYFTTIGYLAPYIFSWPVKFSAQLGLDSFQVAFRNDSRDIKTRARLELKIEKKLSKRVTGFYRLYRLERTNTETFDLNHTLQNSDIERIGSTGPGLIVDFRNNIFNPTSGSYHLFDFELGHPVLLSQSDIGFIMVLSRNSFYIPLFSPFSLTAYVGGGYAKSLFSGQAVPTARLVNELSLGGQPSIRGFTIRQFQPEGTAGETAFLNGRAELGVLLASKFKLVAFFDSGQLFPRLNGSRDYLRHDGFGVGARYETPVGPIAIDFAHGIGPDGRNFQFYFSIGTL